MKKANTILLAATATLMSGCSTILSGTSQQIHVKVIDANTSEILKNASCTINNSDGNDYRISSNPGKVLVEKGHGALRVSCKAKGYKQSRTGYGKSFDAISIVNVLFWPGFIVDSLSGAIQKYPSHIVVEMEKA